MKKLLVLSIVLFFVATVASAQLAEIKVGSGDLTVGGVFQTRLSYSMEDDEGHTNGEFTLNQARLRLAGTIAPDKVKYFAQTDFVGSPGIKDFKMIFINYIPKTAIAVGRYLPNWTKYMPAHTGQLDMINYPLFVQGGGRVMASDPCLPDSTCPTYGSSKWAVWRQVGLQSTTTIENSAGIWAFHVGIFNGSDSTGVDPNNWADENDAKDVMLRVDFKKKIPASWLNFGAYAWLGNLLMSQDEDRATNMFGGFASYEGDQIEVTGEFAMKSTEVGEDVDNVSAMGFYGHAEYKVNPEWGILGRFDFVDPNTDSEAKEDAETWITLGVNHYIASWHAMIYLNYIMKMEQDDWDPSGAGETIDNDLILLQFQVAP